ncbi:MAG: flagellar assembly peptidoglycan hydrolase FlgJ [Pseudomonadota bacterium]
MQAAALYSDFGELASLRLGSQGQDAANRREVAGQFEALFVQMMVKAMRDATPKGGLFNSSQLESYQSMYDQQMALELANRGGIGLADVIMQQFEGFGSSTPAEPLSQFNPLPSERIPSLSVISSSSRDSRPNTAVQVLSEPSIQGVINAASDKDKVGNSISFANPEAFLERLQPLAEEAAKRLGVDADLLLAQSALETGWGAKVLQTASTGTAQSGSSFNFFNIKASSDWHGASVAHTTLEFKDGISQREQARFRAYSSAEESFRDYVDFVSGSPRYATAVQLAADPEAYIRELQTAGYATDPAYADKVLAIRERIQDHMRIQGESEAKTLALKESPQLSLVSRGDD